MNSLKLVSCNVNGMHDGKKRKALFTMLRSAKYDIIFLQETHCHSKHQQKCWSMEWDGQSIWSLGTNKSKGVTVLFNRNVVFNFSNVISDCNGRYIVFELNVDDKSYKFINIYAPNLANERVTFFEMMQKHILFDEETLIAGDFNCSLNPFMDRLNCKSPDIGNIQLKNIIKKFDLEDLWRRRHPEKRMYSWGRGNKASRIDFWLVSKSLDNQVDYCNYKVCPLSDHGFVEMTFRINETKTGKGIWKMNLEIVKTEVFQKCFKGFWEYWRTKKKGYSDIGLWWDLGKKRIKELTIKVASDISKQRKQESNRLEKFIYDQQKSGLVGQTHSLEEAKRKLKEIVEYKGEGARIRSRVNWHEEGEQSSRYFFNLEKRNAKDKIWNSILDSNGNHKVDIKDILDTQVEFYSQLYCNGQTSEKEQEIFLNCIDKKLNVDDKEILDERISEHELLLALKKMKNNKTPGPDGIITEFYKIYWKELSQDLHEVFKSNFERNKLSQSQYLAAIRLIFKKGQRENLKNWRPISLINTDVKILSKVLAERLKLVLPNIIHTDQKGCIRGRYIGQNVNLVRDIIDSCDNEEAILLIDQQKAFDRVEFNWLFKVLKRFDFGDYFVRWLEIMYRNMKSCILTNGYTSRVFPVRRGIRQGDSLSALLYILQAEPLSAYIRQSTRIKGIKIEGFNSSCEVKNKHYVDDTIICLQNLNQVDECLNMIDEFGKASGAKLNREKTIALVMNENSLFNNSIQSNVHLTLGPAKVLGVPLGKKKQYDLWPSIIEKTQNTLSVWKQRNLSLTGKIQVIKSLAISKLTYMTNFIEIDSKSVETIEKMYYEFLWDGKRNRVRKEICVLPRSMGGLGMLDLNITLKVQNIKWIKRILLAEKNEDWTLIPMKTFKCFDMKFGTELFALQVNDSRSICKPTHTMQFYVNCIENFQELCRKGKVDLSEDILWCNNHVRFNGSTLTYAHWAKHGLLYLGDVIKDGHIDEHYIGSKLDQRASLFFDVKRLQASLPNSWLQIKNPKVNNGSDKAEIKILNMQFGDHQNRTEFQRLGNKEMYNILLLSKKTEIRSKQYWQHKFKDIDIDFDMMYKSSFNNFIIPRKCVDFNWKCFHGNIATETKLLKMKFSNGLCKLCEIDIENLEHLLFNCTKLKDIWKNINEKVKPVCNYDIDRFVVMMGVHSKDANAVIINMIVSISRWIIWKRRNLFKFQNEFTNAKKLYEWIEHEINEHCKVLIKCKKVKKDQKVLRKLEQIMNVYAKSKQ